MIFRPAVAAIFWKELREIDNSTWIMFFAIAIFLGIVLPLSPFDASGEPIQLGLSKALPYVFLILMLASGSNLIFDCFYREKAQGTIESLLCTPLNIRDMWTAKVLAVSLIACTIPVVVVGLYIARSIMLWGPTGLPAAIDIFQLITASILAFGIFSLLAYVYLIVLKPIIMRFVGAIMVFGILVLILMIKYYGDKLHSSWLSAICIFMSGLLLWGLSFKLVNRLGKEKIITSPQ